MKQGPIIKNKFKLIVVISYDTTILNKLYLIIKKPQVPEKVMYRIIIKKYFIRILLSLNLPQYPLGEGSRYNYLKSIGLMGFYTR